MNQKNCAVCNSNISFAGSSYCDGENGDICLGCKITVSGNRDDYSYISTAEKLLSSNGVVIPQ